jgi:hypothetical protein
VVAILREVLVVVTTTMSVVLGPTALDAMTIVAARHLVSTTTAKSAMHVLHHVVHHAAAQLMTMAHLADTTTPMAHRQHEVRRMKILI